MLFGLADGLVLGVVEAGEEGYAEPAGDGESVWGGEWEVWSGEDD